MMALPLTAPTSEPQARAGAAAGAALLAARGADDDLLAFLDVAAQDFGRRPVADAEREAERLQLLAVHDVDAAGRGGPGAAAAALAGAHLVVLGALLGGEDLADADAGGLADARALGLALLLGERLHLLARVGEDRVELPLLLLVEAEGLGEPLLHLLARGPAAAATLPLALTLSAAAGGGRRGAAGRGVGTGGTEAQRRVGDLQHVRLLRGDHLDVGRHAGQQPAAGVVDGDHHGVGDHVLHDLGGLADLRDGAGERLPRERVDREGVSVLEPHAPDVGLVHADLDLD